MKITKTTTTTLKFQVYACWPEEGGMGEDYFGEEVEDLNEAIHLLEVAKARTKELGSHEQWFIAANATTIHK